MIGVYAIQSLVNGDIYVGIAKDVESRIKQHNFGKSKYTKGLRPWREIYREQQADWATAREREKENRNQESAGISEINGPVVQWIE